MTTRRERAAPPLSEPVSVVPSERSDEVEAARIAYRALVRAYGARDRAAYEASFAPTLGCFFGRADVERSVLMAERWPEGGPDGLLVAAELALVRHRPGEVYLFDRGFWRARTGRQVLHEKLVRLVRDGAQWRVAAETNREGTACLPSDLELDVHFSADFAACRSAHERCLRASAAGEERIACQSAALGCLGIGREAAPSALAPVTLDDVDAIRRLVRVSLARELEYASVSFEPGGDGGEMSDEDDEWRTLALLAVGAPRIRASMGATTRCGSTFLPWVLGQMSALWLGALRCDEDRQHCVAPLTLTGIDGTEQAAALHLLFDGAALRVSRVESVPLYDEARELARYAAGRPAAWIRPALRSSRPSPRGGWERTSS